MTARTRIDPNELFVQMLIGDRYRPLRHIGLAIILIGLGITNIYSSGVEDRTWLLNVLVFIPLPIILNVYVFVPRILLRNHPYLYLLAVILAVSVCLFTGTSVMSRRMSLTIMEDYGSLLKFISFNSLSTMISFFFIIAGTTALIILQLWLRDRQRIAELEEASNIAELEMLKNQINPHFLFNMLNNAIVLTRERAPQAGEVILKLREMLNYQFEKSHAGKISLEEDISFLDGVLRLEQIRRDRFDFEILVLGEMSGVEVPPLLFIPFVENAIKHGNDNRQESYILLIFNICGEELDFFCTNSVPEHMQNAESGGLGLKNIRRRLELIYGKDHRLDISGTSKTYNVNLTIRL